MAIKLKAEQKIFIVIRFAAGLRAQEIANELKERFDLTVDRQTVWLYDLWRPDVRKEFERKSPALVQCFDTARAALADYITTVALANTDIRVRALERLYDDVVSNRYGVNHERALKILEQIAKETGGAYSAKQQIEHSGSVVIERPLSDDDRIAGVVALLDEARARAAGQAAEPTEAADVP